MFLVYINIIWVIETNRLCRTGSVVHALSCKLQVPENCPKSIVDVYKLLGIAHLIFVNVNVYALH